MTTMTNIDEMFQVVQTFIDQYRFLFCGLKEVMMMAMMKIKTMMTMITMMRMTHIFIMFSGDDGLAGR